MERVNVLESVGSIDKYIKILLCVVTVCSELCVKVQFSSKIMYEIYLLLESTLTANTGTSVTLCNNHP